MKAGYLVLFCFEESRPLSVPVKAMLSSSESCNKSPEERMKEFIGIVWNAVKRLTLQVRYPTFGKCIDLLSSILPVYIQCYIYQFIY